MCADAAARTDELFDRAVDELGLNRLRVEVRSGVESDRAYCAAYQAGEIDYPTWRAWRYATGDDNSDPDSIRWAGFHFEELDHTVEQVVLPIRQRLAQRGKRLLINVNYVAFTSQITVGGSYHHDQPLEYAEYVLATYLHLRDSYGLVPDSWEVILEPDNVAQWNGKLIGQAMVAAGQRLEEHGFRPRFIAPSNANMARAITHFDELVSVPGGLELLQEFSYHRYGGASDDNLRAVASRAEQYGVNTSMLEHIGSGYQDLHRDLSLGRVPSWQQYTLGGPGTEDRGGNYYQVDVTDPNNPVVVPGRRTRFLWAYFRSVPPPATRIGATTTDASFDPLAFVQPDYRHTVIVKAGRARAAAGNPPDQPAGVLIMPVQLPGAGSLAAPPPGWPSRLDIAGSRAYSADCAAFGCRVARAKV